MGAVGAEINVWARESLPGLKPDAEVYRDLTSLGGDIHPSWKKRLRLGDMGRLMLSAESTNVSDFFIARRESGNTPQEAAKAFRETPKGE